MLRSEQNNWMVEAELKAVKKSDPQEAVYNHRASRSFEPQESQEMKPREEHGRTAASTQHISFLEIFCF